MHFDRNISLLRSCITTATTSTTATTFWWGTATVAPQHHPGTHGGWDTVPSSGGTTRSELERGCGAQRAGASAAGVGVWRGDRGGTTRDAALDGGAVRREIGCLVGKTAAAEQQAHAQPTRWANTGAGDILRNRLGDARKQACWAAQAQKAASGRTDARLFAKTTSQNIS
jgi:hypothetical protein